MSIVYMPLFGFSLGSDQGFSISPDLSISCFQFNDSWTLPIFSEYDINNMKCAEWALKYEGDKQKNFLVDSNLVLMAFRIFSPQYPPFIKYVLDTEPEKSKPPIQSMIYNNAVPRAHGLYSPQDIETICDGFNHLQIMETLTPRTHNALYFLYRAFHNDKWVDSFLLMTSAIESLFSTDKKKGATKTISTRVATLLGSADRCTKNDIEQLYDVRSSMTHGRIVVSDDLNENLRKLDHLEYITNAVFRKLVETRKYLCYRTKLERDKFMGTLNTAL